MTKTTNYALPQWEASDPVRRGDFNDAMAALDAGLAAAQAAAEGAQSAAAVAPCVTGYYEGSSYSKDITLGFGPSFVLVSGTDSDGNHALWDIGGADSSNGSLSSNGFYARGACNTSGYGFYYAAFR